MMKDTLLVPVAAILMLLSGVPGVQAEQVVEDVVGPQAAQPADALDAAVVVSRYGTITESRPVGVGGLTAWTVEKGGRKVVLYTTGDAEAIFTGIVWNAATGRNLSDQFSSVNVAQGGVRAPSAAPNPVRSSAFDGDFTAEIPESMKTVDSLAGFKEGDGDIANTLYIIIDPRCPYCRSAYDISREYVKRGFSIKWIPTVALGDPANGLPLAATLLQSEDPDAIDRVLGHRQPVKTQPTKETEDALSLNLAFMFAAFEQNGAQQAGVPVAFFIDRRTGHPRMMTGVSERVVLEDIFGKL